MSCVRKFVVDGSSLSGGRVSNRAAVRIPGLRILALAAAGLIGSLGANAQVNVTTYHNDIGRTGQNLSETQLNLTNVNASQFGKLFAQPVDGLIYAQPLYMSNITIGGTSHNIVIVATEHDSVYAFDADSNGGIDANPLWQISFLSTAYGAAAGATTVSSNIVSTDISPEVGITGTPVIDASTNTLYIVSKTMENSKAVQRLHAIDITTGLEKFGAPVVITATVAGTGNGSVNGSLTFDPLWENQRPGLLLLNGIVYIGFAAHGDNGPWHGWILGYNATTLKQTGAFNASPNGTGSGFWMSGEGLAADQLDPVNKPFGRMFVPTGNGDYTATTPYTNKMDYGDSHLALDLTNGVPTVTDEFTTNQQATLNSQDGDIASGGLMVIPTQSTGTPHLAVQAGKGGTMYLLNRDNLGGYNTTTDQALQEQAYSVGNVGVWSTPAYFNGTVYYWGRFDYLKAFPLVNGLLSTTPTKSIETYGYPGSTPSISANGASQGIVWSINSSGYANSPATSAILQAHSANNVGVTLYSSATNAGRDSAGVGVKFTVPTIANGKVYVGTATELDFYGLLAGVTQTSAPVLSQNTQSYSGSLTVSITDATPNSTIYYTLDGTAATTGSTVYTGPITITSTVTLNAIAGAAGLVTSVQTSAKYTNVTQAATVVFGLPTGTYGSAQSVTLSDSTPNSTIYYTTDGTTPTTSSAVYTSAINVASTETITAVASAPGLSLSPVLAQTYTIQLGATGISYGQGFAASAGSVILNGSAQLNDSRLQLTDGGMGEASSAWYKTPVNIQTFTNDFTFQLSNPVADGMTFAIQNGANGYNSKGGNTYALGYAPIANSIAIKFDLYNSAGEGNDSTGLYLNGANPTVPAIDLTGTGIDLHSDDAMAVHMTYDGTTLTMRITDMVTSAVWSTSWAVNIPSTVGGNTAFVGFTGSTGASSASQKILTWSFVSSAPSNTTAATPTFSPAAGTYTSAQTVTISDTTSGAKIYYTTNGTTPTTSSTLYSTPITVSASETVQAIAVASGLTNSAVGSAAYTISAGTAATPTFSVTAGSYTSTQTVAISDATASATIYYTTNGTTPTTSSSVYSAPITVSSTETIKAIAVASGFTNSAVASAAYTITLSVATPTFSPAAGTYTSTQAVTISSTTTGATIYYTTNGTTPTTSSSVYSTPINVSTSETVQAIAVLSGSTNSAVGSAAYVINASAAAAPAFSPAGGSFTAPVTVSLSDSTSGATIYFTTNGTTPTTSSTPYTGSFILNSTATVKAIAVASGFSNSAVSTATYTIGNGTQTAAPILSVPTGTYNAPPVVTVTDTTTNAVLHYTLNGATPTASSPIYSAPLTIGQSLTVSVIAIAPGLTNSSVSSATYTLAAAAPVASPAGGTYTGAQSITLTSATPGATIFYTTNGLQPSTKYTSPISVTSTTTINAMTDKTGYTPSSVVSNRYVIGAATATSAPIFSLAAGTYTSAQTLTISDSTSGATIYYTTNGTTPTTSSTVYSGAISITASETVNAIAYTASLGASPVTSAAYTINTATPIINFPSGFTATNMTFNGAQLVGNVLQLTDGGPGEARTAWFNTPVNVQKFTTDFNFQQISATADGFTFTIQNAPKTLNVIGGNGGWLGYGGITNSVAVKFDLYSNAGESADSTGFYTGGAIPTVPFVDMTNSPINLHSGDAMHAHITYDGTTLTLTITDTVTNGTFTTSTAISIPTNVGGSNTAYVGFTGGTGGSTAIQNITNWTYTVNN